MKNLKLDGFTKIHDIGTDWELHSTTFKEIATNSQIKINASRQRQYLFKDTIGSPGHRWQRELFGSLYKGEPLPQFEISVDNNGVLWLDDGQHRMRTFRAIRNGAVKLPNDLGAFFFDNLTIDEQRAIENAPMLVLISKRLSPKKLVDRFLNINNGTPLSNQDKRSATCTPFANWIAEIVNGKIEEDNQAIRQEPELAFFRRNRTSSELAEFTYLTAPTAGRKVDEIIAQLYAYTHYKEKYSMGQNQLNKLYAHYQNTDVIEGKVEFENLLRKFDTVVRNHGIKAERGGRNLTVAFYMLKHFTDNNIKIKETFYSDVYKALSHLRGANNLVVCNEETMDFKRFLRVFGNYIQIQTLINIVLKEMEKRGMVTYLDKKRAFALDDKRAKYDEQNGKCGYCETPIAFEDAVGDHKNPHSKEGKTEKDNLVMACKDCNALKGAMSLQLFSKFTPEELREEHQSK